MIKKLIISLLAISVFSCATYERVAKYNNPQESFMTSVNTIAVEPFEVEIESTPITVIQLGKEMESQDIEADLVKNTVRVLVRSPRSLEEYSIEKSDLPTIVRDGIADFLESSEDYDYTLYDGYTPVMISNKSMTEVEMVAKNDYEVVRVNSGEKSSADITIGGKIGIEGTVVRASERFKESMGMDKSVEYTPDTYLFVAYLEYQIDVKDNNGNVIKSYTEAPLKYLIPESFETVAVIPYNTEDEVLSFMKTDEYKDIVSKSIENYMARFIPSFKSYITHSYEAVEE